MVKEYMSELICGVCAYTGHVTWYDTGDDRKVLAKSTHIGFAPDNPTAFTCLKCETKQELRL
jgi:hypothetical protein